MFPSGWGQKINWISEWSQLIASACLFRSRFWGVMQKWLQRRLLSTGYDKEQFDTLCIEFRMSWVSPGIAVPCLSCFPNRLSNLHRRQQCRLGHASPVSWKFRSMLTWSFAAPAIEYRLKGLVCPVNNWCKMQWDSNELVIQFHKQLPKYQILSKATKIMVCSFLVQRNGIILEMEKSQIIWSESTIESWASKISSVSCFCQSTLHHRSSQWFYSSIL